MNDINLSAKNEEKQEIPIQAIRIYNQNARMKFGLENVLCLWGKESEDIQQKGKDCKTSKELEKFAKYKTTNTREYWKHILSTKKRWKNNKEKSISGERENIGKISLQ